MRWIFLTVNVAITLTAYYFRGSWLFLAMFFTNWILWMTILMFAVTCYLQH